MKKLLTFLMTALLAFGVGWADVTDVLNQSLIGITGSRYEDFTGKTSNSDAVYAGNCAGGNSSIQLRSTNNNSGIVTTTSGGKVKSITVVWNSATTDGRTLNVYGKNSAYTDATDLYDSSTQGTLLGTIVKGTSTYITITGDYDYIGFRSASGAMYITSVSIVWAAGGSTTETCAMPMFNPVAGIYTSAQSVTISTATSGASIYYTTDGTLPSSTNGLLYTGAINVSESMNINAIAVKTGCNDSQVAEASYTILSGGGDGKIYRRVTSTNDLVAGQKYIIMYENGSSSVGMGAYDGSKHFNGVENLTISNNKVNIAGTSVLELTLGGSTGAWTLFTGSGYIQGADAVQFNIVDNATANNSKWIISNSIDNTNGFGVKNAQYDRYIKCFNSSTFRHYAAATGAWAYLYVQDESSNPTLICEPNPLNIYDTNETNTRRGSFTVEGSNLGNDNVGVDILAGSGNFSRWTSDQEWGFNNNGGSVNGTVYVSYNGYALSATGQVRPGNNVVNTTVNVNYLYTGPIYVVGNVNNVGWSSVDGVLMTRDASTGQYTVDVNAYNNGDGNAYIFFTKSITGNSYDDLGTNRFGPVSDGNWGLTSETTGIFCPLDTMANLHTILMAPGAYTITIDPATNKFKIEPYVLNVTISPEDGTHFTGSTISGTITSDHADATIEWSTDGTNWTTYSDGFTATVDNVGGSVTVYARATGNGVTATAQATYTRDAVPAPDAPTFSIGSSAVAAGTVVTITAPAGCTLYVNGEQVDNPYEVTINHGTTITAYCVNDEGTPSATVSNTYTIAAVCNAVVEFDNVDEDEQSAITANEIQNYYTAGAGYISSVSGIARIFKGMTGLKFGSSSNGGSITFNLDGNTEWKVSHITLNARCFDPGYQIDYQPVFTVTTSDGQSQSTQQVSSSTLGGYTLDFSGSAITSITISTNYRAYLKGFTLTYDCALKVEAPEITPETGTYYENQTIHMSAGDGCTIYYTTNGSDPTTSSAVFTDDFTAAYTAGSTTTIKAIAVDGEGNISEVTTAVYTWAAPEVVIHPDSRNTTASVMTVTLTPTPADAVVYYTTDGSTPSAENGTLYTGAFTVDIPNVGNQATVKAVAVYSGNAGNVATATYTHVENVLDVHAPFFSPLVNHIYYGDQTLQIGCTTPNADIYYEIVEVSGTTAPNASDVEDPTHASTYYDGMPIQMTVGNSYYVKAIAYVGNNPSTIAEGWYTIEEAPTTEYYYTNLKDFNDKCPTNVTAHFVNPVQVVYHSTYTNNGQFAEFCYLRDNTDYACVYFGKRDTNGYHIFKMGDWIDGSQIAGVTNIWDRNFHIQLGTGSHQVTSWPSAAIGWSEIIPEEMTNDVIVAGTAEGDNVWGHYVHLRNTTLREVNDYSASDPKHTGKINDGTADAYYYDKFYRWSAGTCSYTTGGNTYTDPINCLGDYNQAFFTAKQNAGATFDVYGVVDYYSQYTPPFEMCPIDFLWAYEPQMTPATTTSYEPVTVNITATQPEWAAEGVVIYYKTEDMEEWAVYTGPITVNSTTTIQAYAEVAAEKTDGTNYNDFVRSEIVSETYTIEGIVDPTITPESQVIEIVTGQESVHVTLTDHNEAGSSAVTTYTVNGVEYTLQAGESAEFDVTETTTVTAVSSIVSGEHTLYSNEVSETYEFIEANGKTYDLLTSNPVVGNIYVIVNKADKVGLSTTQNATNRAGIGVTFTSTDKTVVNGNTSLAEFILESANAGRYYFREVGTQNYLCVITNDYANLMTGAADVNAEASATVNSNVTSGVDESYPTTVAFSYEGTTRYLRYYANNRTFTTYGDATANQDIFLYGIAAPELLPPVIDPMSQTVPDGTILNGTVTPDEENPEGALTWYTTDGSDPRTSSTRILWTEDNNGAFGNIIDDTTVKAVTGYEFGDGYVYSAVVSETYTFVFATTLAWIESEGEVGTEYIVANELIGTWAVWDKTNNIKQLWAKDQGNVSIDKRPGKTTGQMDYVKDILEYQKPDWDESNWVILDFGGINADPFEFVGHKIVKNSVIGVYNNNVNYTIQLVDKPQLLNEDPYVMDVPEYPGFTGPFPEEKLGADYDLAYNSYVPANFMTENHNHMEDGNVVGFVADDNALSGLAGDSLYFVNPKIQEVAHVWAVWNGGDVFTVYRTEQKENANGKLENINAWHLNGTFNVGWTYNCTNMDPEVNTDLTYGPPSRLVQNMAYEFHAVIMRPTRDRQGEVVPQGTAQPGTPSADYKIYPLDMSDDGTPTAVIELNGMKTVTSVSYYNVMGVESSQPFDGVNIVVTRYSDGSISTIKVMR